MKTKFKLLIKLNIVLVVFLLSSCEQDFSNIDSDLINDGNATSFDLNSYRYDIKTFNRSIGPYQSNNLPLNKLGVYHDPFYGTTEASVVTQIAPSNYNPDFGIVDDTFQSLTSVVLTIPIQSTLLEIDDDNNRTYQLDSIFPVDATSDDKFRLQIFKSNYFLRTYNPNGDFDELQNYFSNKSLSQNENINPSVLENELIYQNDNFFFDNSEIIIPNDDDPENPTRLAPRIRIEFTPTVNALGFDFWKENIIDKEGMPELSNANNFNDFIRGLYFKASSTGTNNGATMFLNFADANANIIFNYEVDNPDEDATEPVEESFTINFTGFRVDFVDNNYNFPLDNDTNEDSSLFLKGGEGSIAEIQLFEGDSNDDDPTTDNTFEAWRKRFVNLDASGNFESSKRLITEANIVFYVNQNTLSSATGFTEPERVYLYDINNNLPLVDYFLDPTNSVFPQVSISNHLGILERENDQADGKGIRYKLRITDHINNLLLRDSTNVKLGLAVTTNINLESSSTQRLYQVPGSTTEEASIPISSALSLRGTVLHGSQSTDVDKVPKLEIFYACLEDDESDCNEL